MSNTGMLQRMRNTAKPSAPVLACSKLTACALPIAQIAIGSLYLNECPRQHYIPIYLIVVGVFGLVISLLSCLPCAQKDESDPNAGNSRLSAFCTTWHSLSSLFLFGWFIAGNVWIYSIYQPNYNKNATNLDLYCNKTLYLFAFWTTTLVYILVGVVFVLGFCVLLCLFLFGRADPDDSV